MSKFDELVEITKIFKDNIQYWQDLVKDLQLERIELLEEVAKYKMIVARLQGFERKNRELEKQVKELEAVNQDSTSQVAATPSLIEEPFCVIAE